MPIRGPAWDLLLLALTLAGFLLLALASDREGLALSGKPATPRRKRVLRLLAWPLLAAALLVAVAGWHGNFGPVVWFGWLTVAALLVVFGLAWRARASTSARAANAAAHRSGRDTAPASDVMLSPPRRVSSLLWLALVLALPALIVWSLQAAPRQPMTRGDGVTDEVGPWSFRLVEEDQGVPEQTAVGIPAKHLMLRLCDLCDGEVRAAWVQLGAPWSTATRGLRFSGDRGVREALLPIPAWAEADAEVWLTVQGKDGRLHRRALALARVVPTTAAWLVERQR